MVPRRWCWCQHISHLLRGYGPSMWHTNAKPSCIFPRERINSCYDKCEICFTVFSIFYLSGFALLVSTPIIYLSPVCSFVSFGKSSLSFLSHKTINMHAIQHSLILLCKWLNIAIFWLSFFFLLVNLGSLWNDFHTFLSTHLPLSFLKANRLF